MISRFHLFFYPIFFFFFSASGQQLFTRSYLSNSLDWIKVNSIIQKPDSGFFLSGRGDNGLDTPTYVASITSSGILQWGHIFEDSNAAVASLDITQFKMTSNGGLLLAGSSLIIGSVPFSIPILTFLDSLGNLIWSHTYHDTIFNFSDERFTSIVNTSENGFLIGGNHGMLIKTDSVGMIVNASSLDTNVTISTLINLSENNYAAILTNKTIVKLDSNLTVAWTKKINSTEVSIHQLLETFDHGLIVVGVRDSGTYYKAPLIMKLDSIGNIVFVNRADYIEFPYGGHYPCVIQMADSSFLLGTYIKSGIQYKAALCHLQGDGTILSSRQWDSFYHNNSFPDNLINTLNGGYAMLMWFNQSGQLIQMLLGIFDSTGYTNCGTIPATIPWQQDTITTSTAFFSPHPLALDESTRSLSFLSVFGNSPRCTQFADVQEIGSQEYISIIPNPAHSYAVVSVRGNSNEATILVMTDISGRIVGRWKMTHPDFVIGLSDFVKGMYFLTAMDEKQSTIHQRLIVE